MGLREYLRVLRKRWKLIITTLVVCLLAGLAYVYSSTKMYEATAQIFVSTASSDNAANLASGNTFTQARVQSYTSVATSPSVTDEVVAQLGLKITGDQLAQEVSADAPVNKVLINLHVTDRSAVRAALLANALASRFSTVVEGLEQTGGTAPSPVKLSVTHPAQVSARPASPRTELDLAVAVLVGLVLGLGFAFLRELLDNTVKDPDELAQRSHLPVLGIVPWDKSAPDRPASFKADPHGTRAEGFRQMRVNLQFVDVDNPPKIIAVTSAMPGEGKTHTALNLAMALAESDLRVCLIEADLRKPSIAATLGLIGDVGLTSVLIGKAPVEQVMQNAGRNLAVITSGPVPPNPSELLASDQFKRLLAHIAETVDMVVIDTAPLLPVSDGAEMAVLAHATLLTVRAAKTTSEQIERAIGTLANVGVTPVGVVLSMAPHRRKGGYSYYYAEYRPNRPGHAVHDALEMADA